MKDTIKKCSTLNPSLAEKKQDEFEHYLRENIRLRKKNVFK